MVSFTELKTLINTNWALGPGQPNPTIYDKDLFYDINYGDVLFLKMYKAMPIKSQAAAGLVVVRSQRINIEGVYATYALADTALQEVVRILHANKYRMTGTGRILQTDTCHVFSLQVKYLTVIQ